MKAFIDTSSLVKKYIDEKGSNDLDSLLEKTSEIIVSPIYLIEISSAIERRLRDKTLSQDQSNWIYREIKKDFVYICQVLWGDNLLQKSLLLLKKYDLKTLDCIQLSSAVLSDSDIFVTSDKRLFLVAKQELKNAVFL